jgi:hypothetical protein
MKKRTRTRPHTMLSPLSSSRARYIAADSGRAYWQGMASQASAVRDLRCDVWRLLSPERCTPALGVRALTHGG